MRRVRLKTNPEPPFVSQEVTEARRYYLDLNPSRRSRFTVVCFGVERMRPEYRVSRTDFPYLVVEWVTEGEGTLTINGRTHALFPGVVFAYGPGVAHTIRTHPTRRMRKYYLDVAGNEAKELFKAAELSLWHPVQVAAVHEIVELFESLAHEAREESSVARSICETLGRLILLKIQQRSVPVGRGVPRSFETYERVRSYMEQHHLRLQTVDTLARECHLNPMYVARLFRRFARSGAYQSLLRMKMNRAAELLLEEGLLVKETASELGFSDAFQFSRAFKRVHGVPPAELLRRRERDEA